MHVQDWMDANAHGFRFLPPQERDAPMHFALLWSYFEASAMQTEASVTRMARWVRDLEQRGRLRVPVLQPHLDYFRRRYVDPDGQLNQLFETLYLKPKDRQLVEEVLLLREHRPAEITIALLSVVHRIRNNFLHGIKWIDGFHAQHDNFIHAGDILMEVMDMEAGR